MEVKNKFNTVKIATCNDAHKAEAVNQLFERSLLFNRSDDICGIVISKNDEKQFIPISAIPDNVNIEKREGVVTLVENPVVDSITTKADHNGIDWKSQYKIAETSAERTIILLCTKNIENTTNIGVIGGEILEVGEGIYGHYKISLTPAGSGFLKGATTFEQKAALVSAKYKGIYYYGIKFKSTVPANIYFAGWGHFPDAASAPLYTSYNDADLSEVIELGGGDSGGMTEAEKEEVSAMNTQINTNKNDIAALQISVAGKSDTGHTHTKSQITDFPTSLPANGGTADKANNGFNSSTVTDSTPGWGYLTSGNGYSNGRTYSFANGGGIATAEKDTKSSLQVDGDLYVHEGLDKVATLNDIPTSLPANGGTADKVSSSLTFGKKTYNGSSAQTITAGDLGALTSHQTIKQDGITGATVNRFGTCSTAAATAAKTVSITSGTFSLEAGARVSVKFSNANTANNPTLNVGDKGAKNIFHNGTLITTDENKKLLTGVCEFIYDGTQWHLIGGAANKNNITIDIPTSYSNYEYTDKYVILLGKIPEPTSTSSSSYSWDACGSISVLDPSSIHNIAHIRFSVGHGHSHSNKTYIDFDSANFSTSSSIKCFQYDNVWWLGIQIELPAGQYVGNAHITYKRNVPEEFLTAILYCSSSDFAQSVPNTEINSSIQDAKPWWFVTRTWQNPIEAYSFTGNLSGNASTATTATAASRLNNTNITIQTGSTKQQKISLNTLMKWLITTKGYIPSNTDCTRVISTTWNYANNDILQLKIGSVNYELQLAGVIIEFMGKATGYQTGMFRLRIHSSPTVSFTATSGYTMFPASHIAEYTCNDSDYSPTWKMLADSGDIPTYSSKAAAQNGSDVSLVTTGEKYIWNSKAAGTHTHDDRYFTETEVTNKLAGKSDTGHTHTKSQITDFPTSLPANGGTADSAAKATTATTAYKIRTSAPSNPTDGDIWIQ